MVPLRIMSFTTSVNLLPCIGSDLERSLTVYSTNIAKKKVHFFPPFPNSVICLQLNDFRSGRRRRSRRGIYSMYIDTVGTVLTTEVAVNFENFFEGVLAVN